MPSDPVAAGRKGGLKGGRSRSAAKLAAAKRNGFQRRKPAQEASAVLEQGSAQPVAPARPVAVLVPVQRN
jgi:hypothetical protein